MVTWAPSYVQTTLFTNSCVTLHYANVAEIRILKCPTLTNYFSVVFYPGSPKFCAELCELPKNIEKGKKEKFGEEKEEKNAKNMKGVFAKVKTGLKKIVLINATIFALCIFLQTPPYSKDVASKSEKNKFQIF